MADNNKEIGGRNAKYKIQVSCALSSLLMLTGCSRRDILDDYPVSGVDIKAGLGWNDRSTAGGSSGDFLSEERRRQESR